MDISMYLEYLPQIILVVALIYLVVKMGNLMDNIKRNPTENNKHVTYNSGSTPGIPQPVNVLQDTVSETNNTLKIELEIPIDVPKKIRVDPEKALEIIKTLRQESPIKPFRDVGAPNEERGHPPRREDTSYGEEASWSALKRRDNPLLDILEKVSGLEFSEDGNRVYCPRHGWVHYIITSAGDILCGEGHEILWSPNKPRIDRKEIMQLQKDLEKIYSEIEELRKQALPHQPVEYEEERLEEREEGEGEEYGEEEEE